MKHGGLSIRRLGAGEPAERWKVWQNTKSPLYGKSKMKARNGLRPSTSYDIYTSHEHDSMTWKRTGLLPFNGGPVWGGLTGRKRSPVMNHEHWPRHGEKGDELQE